jgi:hypothetical protein
VIKINANLQIGLLQVRLILLQKILIQLINIIPIKNPIKKKPNLNIKLLSIIHNIKSHLINNFININYILKVIKCPKINKMNLITNTNQT